MKKTTSLLEKLKVCWYWLIEHGDGLIEFCHYCQSTKITKVDGYDDGDYYHARYKCRKCGAICSTRERWEQINS